MFSIKIPVIVILIKTLIPCHGSLIDLWIFCIGLPISVQTIVLINILRAQRPIAKLKKVTIFNLVLTC